MNAPFIVPHFGAPLPVPLLMVVVGHNNRNGPKLGPFRCSKSQREQEFKVKEDEDKLIVTVNVHHFDLDDIRVTIENGFLVIEAQHDEFKDEEYCFVSRSFKRRLSLPEGAQKDLISSRLHMDEVLIVKVPLKPEESKTYEKIIPIVKCDKPYKEIKEDIEKE